MAYEEKNKIAQMGMKDKDIYKIALDTRNFEISLFWQRSNYFLVLNSALALGFFKLQGLDAFLLALLGLLASGLWFRVNCGSKFWQSRWEYRLSKIEEKIDPDLQFFFVNKSTAKSDVEKSLAYNEHKGCFHLWVDKQVLKKYSVSYHMTLLSFMFVLTWSFLFIFRLF